MPKQRFALVTGASGGLGRAIVDRLDADGWTVFAGVRRIDAGPLASVQVRPVVLDVTDQASIEAAAAAISDASGGRLDAVVNNAGVSVDGPLEAVDSDDLRELFAVNVLGPVAVTRAVAPLLRTAGGRIVNIGGAAGRSTLPFYGALSASKAALDSLSDAWRMEMCHQGVSVTYIEPGAIATDFFNKSAARARGPAHPAHERYSAATEHATQAMAASPQDDPSTVATKVARALHARRAPARIVVGRQARWALPVLRKMPVRLRDRLVLSNLKVSATDFESGFRSTA